ncbi:MAG: hypothetical protein J6Q29_05340 [Alistipes sp.]|nr:hypothetical protein [Alistipes sp.]
MTIQTIIVYLIGIAVVAWLVRAVVRGYRVRKYSNCSSCDDSQCPYHNSAKPTRPDSNGYKCPDKK